MIMLSWAIIGAIVGLMAYFYKHTSKEELISSVALAALGGLAGGFLSNSFFASEVTGYNSMSLILSIVGALSLTLVGRELKTI